MIVFIGKGRSILKFTFNTYPLLVTVGNVPYIEPLANVFVAVVPVPVHPVVDEIEPLLAIAVNV